MSMISTGPSGVTSSNTPTTSLPVKTAPVSRFVRPFSPSRRLLDIRFVAHPPVRGRCPAEGFIARCGALAHARGGRISTGAFRLGPFVCLWPHGCLSRVQPEALEPAQSNP